MAFHWPRKALELQVTVKTDDEVLALRRRIAELEALLGKERAARNQVEFRYRCECVVNAELVDLCRSHKVDFRAALRQRPW